MSTFQNYEIMLIPITTIVIFSTEYFLFSNNTSILQHILGFPDNNFFNQEQAVCGVKSCQIVIGGKINHVFIIQFSILRHT